MENKTPIKAGNALYTKKVFFNKVRQFISIASEGKKQVFDDMVDGELYDSFDYFLSVEFNGDKVALFSITDENKKSIVDKFCENIFKYIKGSIIEELTVMGEEDE